MPIIEGAIPRDAYRDAIVAGAAAGSIAVAGIKTRDRLISVHRAIGAGTQVTDITDLTSEFTISAAGFISNTGGTATTGSDLTVKWLSVG